LVSKLQKSIADSPGEPPDQVQIEFGLILNAQAGAVLAAASAGANYKVTLTWKKTSEE
jgi:hypothetical protein